MGRRDDVYISQLQAQLREYQEGYKKEKSAADRRYKCLSAVAEKICSSAYGKQQLGGKNKILSLSDLELRDFIIADFTQQKAEYLNAIIDFQKMYMDKAHEVEDLSKKLLDTENKLKDLQIAIKVANEKAKKAQELQQTNLQNKNPQEEPVLPEPTPSPVVDLDAIEKAQEEVKGKHILLIKGKPVDIDELSKTLTESQKTIIQAIGTEGLSSSSDIFEYMDEKAQIKLTNARKVLSSMYEDVSVPLVRCENANTPVTPNRQMYVLTRAGKAVYQTMYQQKPVLTEPERLQKEHKTLQHGLCIKDTAQLLINMGLHDVFYFDKQNTYDVGGGERYVPDITAKTDRNEVMFFEVELAHHNDADFTNKLEKAIRVTNNLYIIAYDMAAKKKLKAQVNRYIGNKTLERKKKKEKATDTVYFYILTMKELQQKKLFKMNKNDRNNVLKL